MKIKTKNYDNINESINMNNSAESNEINVSFHSLLSLFLPSPSLSLPLSILFSRHDLEAWESPNLYCQEHAHTGSHLNTKNIREVECNNKINDIVSSKKYKERINKSINKKS